MIPAAVTRYIAGPGTGKTYELLRRVGLEAEEHGTKIGDLSFVSFARSQTEDVKRRIRSVYRAASLEDIKTTVATVHARLRTLRTADGLYRCSPEFAIAAIHHATAPQRSA